MATKRNKSAGLDALSNGTHFFFQRVGRIFDTVERMFKGDSYEDILGRHGAGFSLDWKKARISTVKMMTKAKTWLLVLLEGYVDDEARDPGAGMVVKMRRDLDKGEMPHVHTVVHEGAEKSDIMKNIKKFWNGSMKLSTMNTADNLLLISTLYALLGMYEEDNSLDQMTYYTYSIGLAVGVKVRYRGVPKGITVASYLLKILELLISPTKCPKVDLQKKSKEIYESVKFMRREVKENIKRMRGGDSEIDLENKVEEIKDLMESTSVAYTLIMNDIYQLIVSESVLGKPPCKFAHIGMGSLARKDITAYSDFENCIVFEDDLQNEDEARKYLRRYSLIFHYIVLCFEETPLRNLWIPELNRIGSGMTLANQGYDSIAACHLPVNILVQLQIQKA